MSAAARPRMPIVGVCSFEGPSRGCWRRLAPTLIGLLSTALSLVSCTAESQQESVAPPELQTAEAPPPAPAPPVKDVPRVYLPSRPGCDAVPVFVRGSSAGSTCVDDAAKDGLTVLDLSDDWTPRVFAPALESQEAPEYRAKYLELAKLSNADLGLYGIAPTMTVLVNRLADSARLACDAGLNMAPLTELSAGLAGPSDPRTAAALKGAKAKSVVATIQSELACAGLLKPKTATGVMNSSTQVALEAFRKRHMIVGSGLDADTVRALALGGEELAFRGVLRGLRERVADASALLEDGSASNQPAKVLERELDLTHLPPVGDALDNGAPDLIDQATDTAARELGWISPQAVREFVAGHGPDGLKRMRVAVTLPPAPTYHSATMDLRVEIDRGDVFYEVPGQARRKMEHRSPSFVLFARSGDRDVALMRWGTTIGGWKKERSEDGEISLKYKESDVGDRMWRRIIAAPAWMPPDSTPETDLVSQSKEGTYTLKRDLIMPGYRNAYGLVMLIHDEAIVRGGKTTWADHGIRTHGSVDYRSIRSGTSHGCHRLYNQLALRLSGFLLQHRASARRGRIAAGYHRSLQMEDQTVEVDIPTRGYLYEMDPPVPVRVLEGRIVGAAEKPISMVPVIKTDKAS